MVSVSPSWQHTPELHLAKARSIPRMGHSADHLESQTRNLPKSTVAIDDDGRLEQVDGTLVMDAGILWVPRSAKNSEVSRIQLLASALCSDATLFVGMHSWQL